VRELDLAIYALLDKVEELQDQVARLERINGRLTRIVSSLPITFTEER
jgi:hypothetical protein